MQDNSEHQHRSVSSSVPQEKHAQILERTKAHQLPRELTVGYENTLPEVNSLISDQDEWFRLKGVTHVTEATQSKNIYLVPKEKIEELWTKYPYLRQHDTFHFGSSNEILVETNADRSINSILNRVSHERIHSVTTLQYFIPKQRIEVQKSGLRTHNKNEDERMYFSALEEGVTELANLDFLDYRRKMGKYDSLSGENISYILTVTLIDFIIGKLTAAINERPGAMRSFDQIFDLLFVGMTVRDRKVFRLLTKYLGVESTKALADLQLIDDTNYYEAMAEQFGIPREEFRKKATAYALGEKITFFNGKIEIQHKIEPS